MLQQLKVKITNGQICMKDLQRLQKKKVFQNLLPNSEQSERLRSIMKKDIVHFLRISRLHKYLKKVK